MEDSSDDTQSSDTSAPPPTTTNIDTNVIEVCSVMCRGACYKCSNCCCTGAQFARGLFITLVVIGCLGVACSLMYLWAIPYSNAIVLMMWPDQPCPSMWQPCAFDGLATFSGWAVHLFVFDSLIAGVVLLIWFACIRGFERNDKFCCPIVRKEVVNPRHGYDGEGLCLFSLSMMSFCLWGLISCIILSYYVGPIIAMATLPQCEQYAGSILSFTLPPKCLFITNTTGWQASGYYSEPSKWQQLGWTVTEFANGVDIVIYRKRLECRNCQSLGFCMLFFPIIGFVSFVWISILAIIYFFARYKQVKKQIIEVKVAQAADIDCSFSASAVSMSDL